MAAKALHNDLLHLKWFGLGRPASRPKQLHFRFFIQRDTAIKGNLAKLLNVNVSVIFSSGVPRGKGGTVPRSEHIFVIFKVFLKPFFLYFL